MDMVPLSVGAASRAWDEQHVDLTAAAGQLGSAPVGGFTEAVAGVAARFATTWQRHTVGLGGAAEAQGDGLRQVVADFLATDDAVGVDVLGLLAHLAEQR